MGPIDAAVGSPERPQRDRGRDARDKPVEVLAFLGLEPGMRVLDMNAASGWYAEILSRAVGPQGHVIAHNHPGASAMLGPEALQARYRDQRLPNVETVLLKHDELRFPPATLDFVLMSMTYHDTYWSGAGVDWGPVDQLALLRGLHEALRPGGIIGVIDHVAKGADPARTAVALHRIDPAIVRRDFQRAGFVLEAQSDVLRNTGDDHLRQVFDPDIQGRTDRFVLRFVKPEDASATLP